MVYQKINGDVDELFMNLLFNFVFWVLFNIQAGTAYQ